jgi:kynurenine 3-monooxygenase
VSIKQTGHAFPPDIGQGINAGLMDVVTLDNALRGKLDERKRTSSTKPLTLYDALTAYERNRGPEHRALIRLAQVGAPFQVRVFMRRLLS